MKISLIICSMLIVLLFIFSSCSNEVPKSPGQEIKSETENKIVITNPNFKFPDNIKDNVPTSINDWEKITFKSNFFKENPIAKMGYELPFGYKLKNSKDKRIEYEALVIFTQLKNKTYYDALVANPEMETGFVLKYFGNELVVSNENPAKKVYYEYLWPIDNQVIVEVKCFLDKVSKDLCEEIVKEISSQYNSRIE